MQPRWSRRRIAILAQATFLFLLPGCIGKEQRTIACAAANDCPKDMGCIDGTCRLPGDLDVRTCQGVGDCRNGESCVGGICRPADEESGQDGVLDGGEEAHGAGDEGEPEGEPEGDEDQRDFSYLDFSLALVRTGDSGPPIQCLVGVRAEPDRGGNLRLPAAVDGHTLSGTVRGNAGEEVGGALVTLLADSQECVPRSLSTQEDGSFSFYLPGNAGYHIQAASPLGPVAHEWVNNLSADTMRDLVLPVGTAWSGGPLTDSQNNNLNGWAMLAYFRTGPRLGFLANQGVKTGPPGFLAGEFTLLVPASEHFDLLGFGESGSAYPLQVLWEDVGLGPALGSHRVQIGAVLKGRVVTASGVAVSMGALHLVNHEDPRLTVDALSDRDGGYQVTVRPGTWDLRIIPSLAAFDEGATEYVNNGLLISNTSTAKVLDVTLGRGERVTFYGRVLDGRGQAVAEVWVRLLINPPGLGINDCSCCEPGPVAAAGDGSFQSVCNVKSVAAVPR